MSYARTFARPILVTAALAGLSGCAAMTRDTHHAVNVTSTPSHATVKLNGDKIGTTPMTAHVSPHDHEKWVISHPGYQAYTELLKGITPHTIHAKLHKPHHLTPKQKAQITKEWNKQEAQHRHKHYCLGLSTAAYYIADLRDQGSSPQSTYKTLTSLAHDYKISKKKYKNLINTIYFNRNLRIAPQSVENAVSMKCMHVKPWHRIK